MKIRIVSTGGEEREAEARNIRILAWGMGVVEEPEPFNGSEPEVCTTVFPWTSIAYYVETKAPGESAIVVPQGGLGIG